MFLYSVFQAVEFLIINQLVILVFHILVFLILNLKLLNWNIPIIYLSLILH